MATNRVFFRIDSSFEIGSGHVYRCLVLADELQSRGVTCIFICKVLPGHFIEYISSKGYRVETLECLLTQEQDAKSCLRLMADDPLIIVDNYFLDETFEHFFSEKTLMVVDDLLERKHECDFYLDQNYRSNYSVHPSQQISKLKKSFLGPHYALIRKSMHPYRQVIKNFNEASLKCLVFFGGSDPTGETLRFIQECAPLALQDFKVTVVVSKGNPFKREIESCLLPAWMHVAIQPADFDSRMAHSHFYFGSGGSVSWERMYLGVPGFTVSIAENQVALSEELSNAGYGDYLGFCHEINYAHVFAAICTNLKNENLRILSEKCKSLVDGEGARRVIDSIIEAL